MKRSEDRHPRHHLDGAPSQIRAAEGVETAEQKDYLLQAGCDVHWAFGIVSLSEAEALKLLQEGGVLHPR